VDITTFIDYSSDRKNKIMNYFIYLLRTSLPNFFHNVDKDILSLKSNIKKACDKIEELQKNITISDAKSKQLLQHYRESEVVSSLFKNKENKSKSTSKLEGNLAFK